MRPDSLWTHHSWLLHVVCFPTARSHMDGVYYVCAGLANGQVAFYDQYLLNVSAGDCEQSPPSPPPISFSSQHSPLPRTHTHARTHTRMHARTHAHTHTHTHACTRTNTHTHTHTQIPGANARVLTIGDGPVRGVKRLHSQLFVCCGSDIVVIKISDLSVTKRWQAVEE